MYKKYLVTLLMVNMIFSTALFVIKEEGFMRNAGVLYDAGKCGECIRIVHGKESISGNRPLLKLQSVEKGNTVISYEDKMILYKIVEAEAGSEDRIGKILVANVVLNRMEDDSFPDSVSEVVFQKEDGVAQFSPVANGRYESAEPKEETVEAVEAAINGEDYSEGALYFMARKYADNGNAKWFDANLDKVVTHGGHEFYK